MKLKYDIVNIYENIGHFENEYLEYWLILQGAARLIHGEKSLELHPHDLISLPVKGDARLSVESFCLTIGRIEISDFIAANTEYMYAPASRTEWVRKTFFYALELYGSDEPILDLVCDSVDHVMFEFLMSMGLAQTSVHPTVKKVIEVIRQHYRDPDFDVLEVIRETGYSSSHFRKMFRDTVGMPPVVFVNNMRLDFAKALIREDRKASVRDIGLRSGFKDPYYFSRIFKQREGISPRNFMKEL